MANQNKTDIGLIGLAVMGENLALNMESKDGMYRFITVPFRELKKEWWIVS